MNWRKRLARARKRKFSTWQIEITTRCPLLCKMCIKSVYRDYRKKDMDLNDFKRLVLYFCQVKSIVLEGWGESLLHPHLLDFVSMTKREGSEVGFVTSGYGLNEDYVRELLKGGLDFIGFSFAGAKAQTHESIRVNSDFERLVASIRYFDVLSKSMKVRPPRMHIVYLILKENVEECPAIVDFANILGIKEVILLNIIQISSEEQNDMRVFTYSERSPYEGIILEAKKRATSYGIRLFTPSLTAVDVAMCPENPLSSIYVSVDGEVSPCVYVNPPVRSPFVRIFEEEAYEVERTSFGNLFQEPLDQIWNKQAYRVFREAHRRRELTCKELFQSLIDFSLRADYSLPPPPEHCRTCHKIEGL
jgi:MoaA/NifB/PqqE/SkfB family radical SAM enzyme